MFVLQNVIVNTMSFSCIHILFQFSELDCDNIVSQMRKLQE